MFIHVYIMTYFMLYSRIIYKITIITFFKLPIFICLYNDLTCMTRLSLYSFHATLINITKLRVLPFSSSLFSYVYIMTWLASHIYHFYSFQATLIDNIMIFMLSSSFIYIISIFTFFKLPLFISLYNDLTCITHLSLLLFSCNLNRHYYKIYDIFQ